MIDTLKSAKENFQPLSRKSLYNINKDGLKLDFTEITPSDGHVHIADGFQNLNSESVYQHFKS